MRGEISNASSPEAEIAATSRRWADRQAALRGEALRGYEVLPHMRVSASRVFRAASQPGVAVERRRIRTEGPLREADHDPSRRRLIPIQIAVRRKSMLR